LWRGWRRNSKKSLFIAGISLGLTLYAYQSSLALIPILGVIWLGAIVKYRDKWQLMIKQAIIFSIGFFVSSGYYIFSRITSPEFLAKSHVTQEFIFSPKVYGNDLAGLVVKQLWYNLEFFTIMGDNLGRHNLPGRPLFGPVVGILFWLGIAIAIWRFRKPVYLFLLLNLAALWLPGFLARNDSGPLSLHLAGVLALAVVFPAISINEFDSWLRSRYEKLGWTSFLLASLILLFAGYNSYVDYFIEWREMIAPTHAFDEVFVQTAQMLNDYEPQPEVWILSNNGRSRQGPFINPSFRFLYTRDTPVVAIPARVSSAQDDLSTSLQDVSVAGLVEWYWDTLKWATVVYGDRKHTLRFLMEKSASLQTTVDNNPVALYIYDLPQKPDFAFPSPSVQQDLDVEFGQKMSLVATDSGGINSKPSAASGETMWLALKWHAITPPQKDYKAAVFVADDQGHIIVQNDAYIFSDSGASTKFWKTKGEAWDFRLISIPTAPPPWKIQYFCCTL
jgi:hypothetical protein